MPSDLPGLSGVADLAYRTRGGQALIYDGVHARGPCVVKILSAEAASSDDELVERFAREVEVLGMMTEPAVVQLWGRGVYLGRSYAVLEAIEGRTFAEVIAAGPVAVDQALAWIDELLQVVSCFARASAPSTGSNASGPDKGARNCISG